MNLQKATAILGLTLTVALPAFAENLHLKISGMHCGACQQAVEKKICEKDKYAKCEAKIINSEAQIGELVIESKPGQTLATADILKNIEKIGYKPEVQNAAKAVKK